MRQVGLKFSEALHAILVAKIVSLKNHLWNVIEAQNFLIKQDEIEPATIV